MTDKLLQIKIRELADIVETFERINYILSKIKSNGEREKYVDKRNEQIKKRDVTFNQIENAGLEYDWITTLVRYERENLEKAINDARNSAYKEHFGEVDIAEIDLLDERWDLIGAEIEQARINYIEGN